MKLTPSVSGSLNRYFVLLAPEGHKVPAFTSVSEDPSEYERMLAELQRLRGDIYSQDRVIRRNHLTQDGRHVQSPDRRAWHLLTMEPSGTIAACARYVPNASDTPYSELTVADSSLAKSPVWGGLVREAVQADLSTAGALGVSFVEIGGWAVTKSLWCSTEAVRMVIALYALGQILGGALGISTVTTKHSSSSILRRMGGNSLCHDGEQLPSYFDPQYGCDMEILRFDSRQPNPRYLAWIEESCSALLSTPVISSGTQEPGVDLRNLQRGLLQFEYETVQERVTTD